MAEEKVTVQTITTTTTTEEVSVIAEEKGTAQTDVRVAEEDPAVLPKENASTEERVRGIICKTLGVSADDVNLDSSFIEDLGADSLDIVELVMTLEEEYKTVIPDEQTEKIRTVRDVIEYIESQK